ncbi:MAG: Rab family GTPase [Candidatus Thorarchaeota archaeon]
MVIDGHISASVADVPSGTNPELRIVMLGEAGVGKTALITRFVTGTFDGQYRQSMGTTVTEKRISIRDSRGTQREVTVRLMDMGGRGTYRELRRQFMKGAHGAVLVYDVTRPETFMAMNNWYETFRDSCPDACLVICANKVDLKDKRMVPFETGVMLQKWLQADYFETSAENGQNVSEAFLMLVKLTHDRYFSTSD